MKPFSGIIPLTCWLITKIKTGFIAQTKMSEAGAEIQGNPGLKSEFVSLNLLIKP